MRSRKFIIFILLMGYTTLVFSQNYTVHKKVKQINSTKYKGVLINIDGEYDKVTDHLYDYLRERGKIKRKRNYYIITAFKTSKIMLDNTITYLRIEEKENSTLAWMAINPSNHSQAKIAEVEKALESELILMARSYYVDHQAIKIKKSETIAQIVSKKQEKLLLENSAIKKNLEEAEKRKVKLLNQLEENKLTIETLKQKLINNKSNQESMYLSSEKIQRIIQGQKQELKKIN